jgi:hypothetical protein
MQTLRGYKQTCRVKVRIDGAEHNAWLLFSHQGRGGQNISPIGNRVHLEPLGEFDTDAVELVDVLPWVEP